MSNVIPLYRIGQKLICYVKVVVLYVSGCTAEIAGIQAAKRTAELIPLCHPVALSQVTVRCELLPSGVEVTGTATCLGQTGVEMEALTAVSVALLTMYDMCKAVDKKMVIGPVKLVSKTKTPVTAQVHS